ncbi:MULTISPECIES: winged helix-turn-helix domain-containing protein [unclassified Micromonospora]|uniref:winged helix-turn-helix domain-containing protein n=1 Tax=unclassified Micromonospora TaxID=2617518 RepID=UPI0010339E93|nr:MULTISPECIES: winged helix-turn-helix domain-containing protein [unclassified Micromonospora]QKW14822.1 winged helix-turn-helix transcriptional regulator [Verrucosispora sp. NA02020]TBL35348.1 winged helix family transcriptional regulator [Verrucosispora sp. SN26_14.1]
MSVSPASSRAGWHTSQPAVPGRPPGGQRRPANSTTPVLTVTLSIPLVCEESLTPAARRLLDAARELLERGEGTIVASPPVVPERRTESVPAGRAPSRQIAPTIPTLHILASSRSVLRDGEPLPLTRLEFDLLLHLVAHPRRVFTRLQLLNAVWGYEHAGVRTVDVHVRRLRGKVGVDVPLVTTVYGVGYRLADDARVTLDRTA